MRNKGSELFHPSVKFEDVGGNDETLKVSYNFIGGLQDALNKMCHEKWQRRNISWFMCMALSKAARGWLLVFL